MIGDHATKGFAKTQCIASSFILIISIDISSICKPASPVDVAYKTIALSWADQAARWHQRHHVSPISIACSNGLRPKQNIEKGQKEQLYTRQPGSMVRMHL